MLLSGTRRIALDTDTDVAALADDEQQVVQNGESGGRRMCCVGTRPGVPPACSLCWWRSSYSAARPCRCEEAGKHSGGDTGGDAVGASENECCVRRARRAHH